MSARFLATIAAAGVATVSLFSASAQAEPAVPSVTVSLGNYDLSRPADASAAYARLQRAARAVCNPPLTLELKSRQLHQQCYAEALTNAVARIDSKQLTALHASSNELRIASRTDRSRT